MLARISDPQVSPNGRYVVYVQRETDFEANRGRNDLWLVDLSARRRSRAGSRSTPPTTRIRAGRSDGTSIYFLSSRAGSMQIWRLPMPGGEAVQITDYPLDVGTFKFSPDGERIALAMDVFPDCADLKCTRARLDAAAASKVIGAQLRRPVRASLGHLARPHALEPVRRAGARRRPRRHAGQRQPARSMPTCLPSPMAATRNSPSRPTANAWCSARGSPAARKPWSTNFDLYEVAGRRQRGAEESHGRQSGLGHAAGIPEEWRPRVARDEAARIRSGSLRASSCATAARCATSPRSGTAPSRIST